MSPAIHLIGSWLVAAVVTDNSRDRKLVTWAGVLPDADGLGMLVDSVKSAISGNEDNFYYYHKYHHMLLHGWPGAVVVSLLFACFARKKPHVLFWCLFTFHLHLVCDLVGSRGPNAGDIWPIYYSEPLFRYPVFFWNGQWKLDGWQNETIYIVLLLIALCVAIKRGYSFIEVINQRLDSIFVKVLQKWCRSFFKKSSNQSR